MPGAGFARPSPNMNYRQYEWMPWWSSVWAAPLLDMAFKIRTEKLECALQWFHGTGGMNAEGISGTQEFRLLFQYAYVFP